jgi:hypothetical protein
MRVTHDCVIADRTTEYLWLSIVGDKSGIEVPVPRVDILESIDEGATVTVVLESENDQHTAWCVAEVVEPIENPSV